MLSDRNQPKHSHDGPQWKAPTTRIHVGGVVRQRAQTVGHQQGELGPRGIAYRLASAEGTVVCYPLASGMSSE